MHWIKLTLVAFCVAELTVLAYARAASGLAHLHAVQQITDPSPSAAAAACREAEGAIGDFSPALMVLNVARLAPVDALRAWGELPRLADAVSAACPPVQLYASIAPWRDTSLEDGAAADVLAQVRRVSPQLSVADQQLGRAWSVLESVDVHVLGADPRLARAARALDSARAAQADVADALTIATPDRIETLLGGKGPRALVLALENGQTTSQAYAVLHDGRVVTVDVGQPPVPAVLTVSVDRFGLQDLVAATGGTDLPNGTTDNLATRAALDQLTRLPVSDYQHIASILRDAARQQHASLQFDDPALQTLVARRGWVRQ